jgi:hypothetical protein
MMRVNKIRRWLGAAASHGTREQRGRGPISRVEVAMLGADVRRSPMGRATSPLSRLPMSYFRSGVYSGERGNPTGEPPYGRACRGRAEKPKII